MLTHKIERLRTALGLFTLLFIISFNTFIPVTFAGTKKNIAVEYRNLGYDAQQKGDFVEALSYYKKAIVLGAEDSALLNDMGILFEKTGLFSEALEAYQRALAIDDKYLPSYMNLGFFYKNLGDLPQAEKYFKERFERGQPNDPWAQRAREELVKIRPDYQNWFDFLDEQKKEAESQQLAKEVLKKKQQEFYQLMLRAKEHVKKGEELMSAKKYQEAIREFDSALKITPSNLQVVRLKKQAMLEITKSEIQARSDHAVKMLDAGDAVSAKREIQSMLTTIPSEPMGHSR